MGYFLQFNSNNKIDLSNTDKEKYATCDQNELIRLGYKYFKEGF